MFNMFEYSLRWGSRIESGGLHEETGGGRRWKEGVKRGGKEGFGKCFSTVHHLSPHRQQLCQLNAPWHRLKKREVKSLRSVIKTPPILTWAGKKYLRTKGVDPQTTSSPPCILVSTRVPGKKECGLLWQTPPVSLGLSYEEVLPVTKTLHNGTFLVARAPASPVRLATRVSSLQDLTNQRK